MYIKLLCHLDIRGEEKDATGSGLFRVQHKVRAESGSLESGPRKMDYLMFLALVQPEQEQEAAVNGLNGMSSSALNPPIRVNLDQWLAELRLRRKIVKASIKIDKNKGSSKGDDLLALL